MKNNINYPCSCESMRWFNDNYRLFLKREGRWMLNFINLDSYNKSFYKENFGISIQYCMFCGKKLND